jgi:hypothetical protein
MGWEYVWDQGIMIIEVSLVKGGTPMVVEKLKDRITPQVNFFQ